jgi:hypothetical protein
MTDAAAFPDIRASNYAEFVAGLRRVKEHIGLSDSELDEVAFLPSGHAGKLLGPSRERGLGALSLDKLMEALPFDVVFVVNPEKLARLQERGYKKRGEAHVRNSHRIGKSQIAKVRPIVLQEAARKAANARWADSTPETRADFVARLNKARAAKRHARMTLAA